MTTNTAAVPEYAGAAHPPGAKRRMPGLGRRAGALLIAGVLPWLRRAAAPTSFPESRRHGRAPEGAPGRRWVRSDDDMLRECLQALSWSAGVPEGAVRFDVHRGHVVLTGTVGMPHERAAAEVAILGVAGVVSVSNLVGLAAASAGSGIADVIHAAVCRSREASEPVEVRVDGACVLLSGRVRSWRARSAAVAAAWAAPGIAHVIDEIVVQPSQEAGRPGCGATHCADSGQARFPVP